MSSKQKRSGECAVCGAIGELTDDHLPQRALYPKSIRPRIKNMNTVRVCHDCNNGAATVDEVMKVFVGLVGDSPWRDALEASVDATLAGNLSIARMLDENARTESVPQQDGTYRDVRVVKFPSPVRDKIFAAIERLVKALFYQDHATVLEKDYELSMFAPEGIHSDLYREIDNGAMGAPWKSLNSGTFHYCFFSANGGDTICIVNFYENIEFCFCIRRKGWRLEKGSRAPAEDRET